MDVADWFMLFYVVASALWFRSITRKTDAMPKSRKISVCDEAIAECVICIRRTERYVPPGRFKVQGSKHLLVSGERFKVIVERAP